LKKRAKIHKIVIDCHKKPCGGFSGGLHTATNQNIKTTTYYKIKFIINNRKFSSDLTLQKYNAEGSPSIPLNNEKKQTRTQILGVQKRL